MVNQLKSERKNKKMADDGRLKKMEVDYSSTVDEKIPEADKLAKVCHSICEVKTLTLRVLSTNSSQLV